MDTSENNSDEIAQFFADNSLRVSPWSTESSPSKYQFYVVVEEGDVDYYASRLRMASGIIEVSYKAETSDGKGAATEMGAMDRLIFLRTDLPIAKVQECLNAIPKPESPQL